MGGAFLCTMARNRTHDSESPALPYQSYRQPRRIAEKPGPWSSRSTATEQPPPQIPVRCRTRADTSAREPAKRAAGTGRIPLATLHKKHHPLRVVLFVLMVHIGFEPTTRSARLMITSSVPTIKKMIEKYKACTSGTISMTLKIKIKD